MATTTQTPYMSLQLPIPLIEISPTWAVELNSALTVVDAHNHASGNGVQVPTAGLNINADLSFAGFNGTNMRAVRMNNLGAALSGASDVGCLYVSGGDLYYNSASGQQVHITSGAALNISSTGGISGLSGTNAALTYSATNQTFSFTQNSGITASIASGPISVAQNVTGAPAVTLQSAASLAAAYSLTLPVALPTSAAQFMTTDTAGNLSWTAQVSSSQIANGAVGAAQKAALNYGISSYVSGTTYWSSAPPYGNWTPCSVTITTSGRPVMVQVVGGSFFSNGTLNGNFGFYTLSSNSPTGTSVTASYGNTATINGNVGGYGTYSSTNDVQLTAATFSGNMSGKNFYAPAAISMLDLPAAGTYTYNLTLNPNSSSTGYTGINSVALLVYEM